MENHSASTWKDTATTCYKTLAKEHFSLLLFSLQLHLRELMWSHFEVAIFCFKIC